MLIDAEWVLTSAHCLAVTEEYYGQIPDSSNTVFYIGGNNASPTEGGGAPAEGELYQVEQIIVHPDYTGAEEHDIALVKLSEAVAGVTPAGYNTTLMSSSDAGSEYRTAGFDASYYEAKKETHLEISTVYTNLYDTATAYTIGDSGIVMLDNDGKALGLCSAVYPDGADPFHGATSFIRIGAYASWIAGVMSE